MGILKMLKDVMTGEVVTRMDTPANGGFTTMSLRLKKNRSSGEHYVVLGEISAGNYQYVALSKEEFGQFAQSVNAIRDSLNAT